MDPGAPALAGHVADGLRDAGAVPLDRGAVAAGFAEVRRANGQAAARHRALRPGMHGVVPRRCLDVYGTADLGCGEHEAARGERLSRAEQDAGRAGEPPVRREPRGRVRSAFRQHARPVGPTRSQRDHTGERVRAMQIAGGPPRDRGLADPDRRVAVPVDPSAHRIVERHAVRLDERAARPGRGQPAQRHPLRRRVRHPRRGPAEQAEARHGAERIVERERRPTGQLLAREHRDGRGCRERGRGAGDDHRLGDPRTLQLDRPRGERQHEKRDVDHSVSGSATKR